jgi:hypothetical protein
MSALDTVKKVATSRVGQLVLAFVAGGVITGLFLPEKTIIKKEEVVVYKDKIVEKEVVKYVDRIVEKVVEKEVQIKKVWTKTTFPDGKIVETEVYEENSQQIDRMKQLESERYKEQLAEVTKEYEKRETYLKQTLNPRKFSLYGGVGTQVDDPQSYYYLGGMQGQIWGPLMIGMEATSHKDVAVTVGIRF